MDVVYQRCCGLMCTKRRWSHVLSCLRGGARSEPPRDFRESIPFLVENQIRLDFHMITQPLV